MKLAILATSPFWSGQETSRVAVGLAIGMAGEKIVGFANYFKKSPAIKAISRNV
jgi:hypothetical protein